jgi:CelD/BcsL family acetyltransferase involved in cellulose biosynthesis
VCGEPGEVAPHRREWHELAVACGRPFLTPAFALAWFRHCRPHGSALRVVCVYAGDELVGVAPFFVTRGLLGAARYRVLGSGTVPGLEPLARGGSERDVAGAIGAALHDGRPRAAIVSLSGIPDGSPWPELLAAEWPGARPTAVVTRLDREPVVRLGDAGYEGWLRSRPARYRQQLRRRTRRLQERGGECVVLGPAELADGVEALVRGHRARWQDRGGSRLLTPAAQRLLTHAPAELDGVLQLVAVRLGGDLVAASAFVRAGDTLVAWLMGFQPAAAAFGPGPLLALTAVRTASDGGQRRIGLGTGDPDYKLRLATDVESLRWVSLVDRGSRYPLARLRVLPEELREVADRRLPERSRRVARRTAAAVTGGRARAARGWERARAAFSVIPGTISSAPPDASREE